MSYTFVHQDAFKFIQNLKKNNTKLIFDAVITDPPYNISRKNNFKTINRNGIDFGKWDYSFDQIKWIKEVFPIIKPGGSIIIFNDWKNMGLIQNTLEEMGFKVKDLIRWKKSNPMPRNITRRYVTDFEWAIWAVKPGATWTFNFKPTPKEKYLRPEFTESIVAKSIEKIHPTQKPTKLLEKIIKIHTNEGDIIFDPFAGSGSTSVAAMKNKRIFYGCEINPIFYQKAKARLERHAREQIIKKKVNRSPLYYLGDKYRLLPQIINFFPKKINTFYDVFGGGGTMLTNINYNSAIYNDTSKQTKEILNFFYKNKFEKIYKNITTLIDKWELNNLTNKQLMKKNFLALRTNYNDSVEKSSDKSILKLIVLIIYSFNSQIRFNSRNLFNIPVGKQGLNSNRKLIFKNYCNTLIGKKITFKNLDFEQFLQKIKIKKNDFFYFDPPYLLTNATYNAQWSYKDEKRLLNCLDILNKKGAKWALSNVLKTKDQEHKLLKEWSKKYNCFDLNYNYNNCNYQRKSKSSDQEVLITNFENKKF